MKSNLLTSFELSIDTETLYESYWLNNNWYESFLTTSLYDLNVNITSWSNNNNNNNYESNELTKIRSIHCYHPSHIKFPGLSSHTESLKYQTLVYNKLTKSLRIREINFFNGIPFADHFTVITELICSPVNNKNCDIHVYVDITFHKPTLLKGSIISNTKKELTIVYKKLFDYMNGCINLNSLRINSNNNINSIATSQLSDSNFISTKQYYNKNVLRLLLALIFSSIAMFILKLRKK